MYTSSQYLTIFSVSLPFLLVAATRSVDFCMFVLLGVKSVPLLINAFSCVSEKSSSEVVSIQIKWEKRLQCNTFKKQRRGNVSYHHPVRFSAEPKFSLCG